MTIIPECFVAVASGSHEQTQEWSRILKAAKVDFHVVKPCGADSFHSDYEEMWVPRDDVETARAILQKQSGKTRLW
jgi:hypothetical protein